MLLTLFMFLSDLIQCSVMNIRYYSITTQSVLDPHPGRLVTSGVVYKLTTTRLYQALQNDLIPLLLRKGTSYCEVD